MSHSYEWGGLAVPVLPGSGRTDAAALRLALGAGWQPLPDSIADCRTELRIQGCALGRDTALLGLLGIAFGGADSERPSVTSSNCLVSYRSERSTGRPRVERSLAEYWYVSYPKGQRPGKAELARRLSARHPNVPVNWHVALSRSRPPAAGECWSRCYELPVRWLAVAVETAAEWPTGARGRREWLAEQLDLRVWLGSAGLRPQDLFWTIRDTSVNEDGQVRSALLCTGRATVVCVEREIALPDIQQPWHWRRLAVPEASPAFSTTVAARPSEAAAEP